MADDITPGENRRGYRHGMHNTPQYRAWCYMIERLTPGSGPQRRNPNYTGVTCDPAWRDFVAWWADMAIDREGNAYGSIGADGTARGIQGRYADVGDYCRENVRWQTRGESTREMIERRMRRTSGGLFAADVARENGIPRPTWHNRVRRGWSIDEAVGLVAREG